MISLTEENYLKALFHLSADTGEAGLNELSRQLGVKMPTATSMMKKLGEKKLVHYESYKPVRLTEKGKKEARLIIRKHRLTEMFLVEKMGFGWEQVHDIAEQVEHLQAPAFFEKMDELLGYPTLDPHGSPIPDKNGRMPGTAYRKLSTCPVGETVIFAAVLHTSNDFLKFLNGRDLKRGVVLEVKSIEPFDQSMAVAYDGHPAEMLSRMVCERLLVEKAK